MVFLVKYFDGTCAEFKSHDKVPDKEKISDIIMLSHSPFSIVGLSEYKNINRLDISGKGLISLGGIENFSNLRVLDCSFNNLRSLSAHRIRKNIEYLMCNNNSLVNLDGLEECVNLEYLCLSINKISSLSPLYHLRRLRYIQHDNNPIELTIQSQRFLERIRVDARVSGLQVYSNSQNVHNLTVQKSVLESISNLLKDHIDIDLRECLDEISKCISEDHFNNISVWCSESNIHSYLNIKYSDLMLYVWNRIRSSEHKSDLIEILKLNINDSIGYCFTGKMNKLLNTLCGFYNDIQIKISDREQAKTTYGRPAYTALFGLSQPSMCCIC